MIGWLVIYSVYRKSVGSFKDKVTSIFKINTPKQTVYEREKKLSKPKTQNTRYPFILKKKKRK